jgi:hypothetical protein
MAAKYKIHKCHRCGADLKAARFDDIHHMRVMGKIHAITMKGVPCMYCSECGMHLTDSGSDEVIMYWYNRYINENGLNKFRHKVWRFCARTWRRAEWWFYNSVAYRRRNSSTKTK